MSSGLLSSMRWKSYHLESLNARATVALSRQRTVVQLRKWTSRKPAQRFRNSPIGQDTVGLVRPSGVRRAVSEPVLLTNRSNYNYLDRSYLQPPRNCHPSGN